MIRVTKTMQLRMDQQRDPPECVFTIHDANVNVTVQLGRNETCINSNTVTGE
jgi:hypothetical protein